MLWFLQSLKTHHNYYPNFLLGTDIEPKGMMDVALISSIDPVDIGLAYSEKANSAPSIKPKKKTMTSVYLKYFETAPDGKSRKCKFCGQSYSIATATGIFYTFEYIL